MSLRRPVSPSRRLFLRGAATALALPWLPSLAWNEARAAVPPPVRLVWWFIPNGVNTAMWACTGFGSDYALSPTLAALAPHREHISVLEGVDLSPPTVSVPGHLREGTTFLTGRTPVAGDVRAGASIDQLIAAAQPRQTAFASLQVSLEGPEVPSNLDAGWATAYYRMMSWADATTPLPPATSPIELLYRVLGLDAGLDPLQRARLLERRSSVLDALASEATHLQRSVGWGDRHRLDRYLTSVRDLELRLQRLEELGTCVPDEAGDVDGDDFQGRTDALADTVALAFACDATRIVTFAQGNAGSMRAHSFLGIFEPHHLISHHQNKPAALDALARIDRWEVERFARFLQTLKGYDEGEGSLLDQCAILLGAGLSDGDAHNDTNLPIVLAGSAGGALTPGQRLDLGGRDLMDVHLTMAEAAGTRLTPTGSATGPVASLLAT